MSDDIAFEAHVTQYDVTRIRLGQAALPFATIAVVLARRFPNAVSIGAAAVVMALALFAFISAVRRMGWQQLRFEPGVLWFGSTGVHAKRFDVRDWTLVGRVARLDGAATSYRLRIHKGGESALEARLRGVLGRQPTRLKRRGSLRARMIGLGVAGLGLIAVVASFLTEALALTFLGTPAFVFGLATFGALTQRVKA